MVSELRRWLACAALLCAVPARGAELEGVVLDDRIRVDGQVLALNGMALRTRVMFRVYVAGLYLPVRTASARVAIESKGAKRIILVMLREASAQQFIETTEDGLRANNSEEQMAAVRQQWEELAAKIRGVGKAAKGMRVVLDYAPSYPGTTLFIDGVAQGNPMVGEEFYRALLRIWLGDNPGADTPLKKGLLGQSVE